MLAFVDESGDPGRKILNRSSRYFVVAVVTFEDHLEAQACDERITLLRGELGYGGRYEFHFSKNSRKVRDAFLAAVAPYQFFYHVFALNKDLDLLWGPGFDHKESLYKYAAGLTFENAKPYLTDAKVVLDGTGDRKFRGELRRYLKRRVEDSGRDRLIRSVSTKQSHRDNLLQLADYVAGVSNRAFCERDDGLKLRRTYLAAKELTPQIWPKK